MDIYDLRRAIVAKIVKERFDNNQSAFGSKIGAAPSYVSRMLKPQSDDKHKKIGEEMARKLEGIPELGLRPGELLDPAGQDPSDHASESVEMIISDTVWDTMQDLNDMSDADREFLRAQAKERADAFRSIRKQVLAQVGITGDADAANVKKALGGKPKGDGRLMPGEIRLKVTKPKIENTPAATTEQKTHHGTTETVLIPSPHAHAPSKAKAGTSKK